MCNRLKDGNRVYKIPEYGYGYKVFQKPRKGRKTIYSDTLGARYRLGQWVKWDEKKDIFGRNGGFCFLLTPKGLKSYNKFPQIDFDEETVYKIRYRKGLGRRGQKTSYKASLCKEFKILNEVKPEDLERMLA